MELARLHCHCLSVSSVSSTAFFFPSIYLSFDLSCFSLLSLSYFFLLLYRSLSLSLYLCLSRTIYLEQSVSSFSRSWFSNKQSKFSYLLVRYYRKTVYSVCDRDPLYLSKYLIYWPFKKKKILLRIRSKSFQIWKKKIQTLGRYSRLCVVYTYVINSMVVSFRSPIESLTLMAYRLLFIIDRLKDSFFSFRSIGRSLF